MTDTDLIIFLFTNPYFIFSFLAIIVIVASFLLGRFVGELEAIRSDFKSIDYDRIIEENEDLKRAIEIKRK